MSVVLDGFVRTRFGFPVRGVDTSWRMTMAQKRQKVKHENEGIKPTIDALYVKERNRVCFVCNKFVHRSQASIEHLAPKKYLGSLRFQKTWLNSGISHQRCNQLRGSPVPLPFVLRWDEMPESEHEYAKALVRKMERYWKDVLPRDVARFVYDNSGVVPKARKR